MFSLLKKYELRGAKRRVRLFNRFQIESVLKIAPYHTLKFGGIEKLAYLCIVIQERRKEKRKPARRRLFISLSLHSRLRRGAFSLAPSGVARPTKSTFNIQQSTLKTKDHGSKRNIEIS